MMNNETKTKRKRVKVVNKVEPMLVYSTSKVVNNYFDKSKTNVTQSYNF